MPKINKVLWNLRQDLEFNYRQMGELFGGDATIWYMWERQEVIPKEVTRRRIAAHFNKTVDDIWPGHGHIELAHTRSVVHAMRPSGVPWCKHVFVVADYTEGQWEEVTCVRCRDEKYNKHAKYVAARALRAEILRSFERNTDPTPEIL